jgi:hypothetical protein
VVDPLTPLSVTSTYGFVDADDLGQDERLSTKVVKAFDESINEKPAILLLTHSRWLVERLFGPKYVGPK